MSFTHRSGTLFRGLLLSESADPIYFGVVKHGELTHRSKQEACQAAALAILDAGLTCSASLLN